MTKQDLIDASAKEAGISKVAAGKALAAILAGITASLKKGDSVSLVGFGSFNVTKRAARKGKNPRTGEAVKIAARTVAKFRPGTALKAAVNKTKPR